MEFYWIAPGGLASLYTAYSFLFLSNQDSLSDSFCVSFFSISILDYSHFDICHIRTNLDFEAPGRTSSKAQITVPK